MPTNLPPEYFEAERRYKEASTTREKIDRLEELMGTIPKHKGTDKLRADLRRRLSKLKDSVEKKKKTGIHESPFHIEKEGAARGVLVGPPNTGKSSILKVLTNAHPSVSAAPFTTWTPAPGMLNWEEVPIQLIDTPPLNREHMESELFDLVRSSDILLLVINIQADALQQLEDSLEILKEHRIALRGFGPEKDTQSDERGLPFLVIINKNDSPEFDEDFQLFKALLEEDYPLVTVSAETGRNLDELKKGIFTHLNMIRVFSKPPGKEPDMTAPFALKKGTTVEEFAGKVHKDFLKNLKSARVWGKGVYDGQLVGRDHVLQDGDIVELHL
ncbi:MAG: TGS domain-containing protein [Calditrichaeota bacterium]|nr:TGS domain-containing protein [Calditrichota bacterium]RQV99688.1 MAG: TGS domain-containing protein [Calditrichota bacterium]